MLFFLKDPLSCIMIFSLEQNYKKVFDLSSETLTGPKKEK